MEIILSSSVDLDIVKYIKLLALWVKWTGIIIGYPIVSTKTSFTITFGV